MKARRQLRRIGSIGAMLFALILTGLMFWMLLFTEAGQTVNNTFAHLSWSTFLLYLVLSSAALFLRALRYEFLLRLSLRDRHCPSRARIIALAAIRNMFVDILPARLGELSFFYVLKRNGVRPHRSVSTFSVAFLSDIVVLFVGLLVFVVLAAKSGHVASDAFASPSNDVGNDTMFFVLGVLALVSTLFVGLVLWRLPELMPRLAVFIELLQQRIRTPWVGSLLRRASRLCRAAEQDLHRILGWRGTLITLLLTLELRAVKYVSLYYLFCGALMTHTGVIPSLRPTQIVASFVVAEGVASLPVSGFFNFGSYEATLTLCLALFGLTLPLAVVVGVGFFVHLSTQVVGSVVGMLGIGFLVHLNRSGTSRSVRYDADCHAPHRVEGATSFREHSDLSASGEIERPRSFLE